MSDDEESTVSTDGLDKIIKMFGAATPVARVGILGQKAARGVTKKPTAKNGEEQATLNNAEIGAFHEFGQGNNPERSFLRAPISERLDKALEESGALDKDVLKDAMKDGTLVSFMKKVAVVAEGIVIGAFDSDGYGKWLDNTRATQARKKNDQTLVETGQLRNSITSDVKKASNE